MIVELISTGTELLLGHIVNTNAAYLGQVLNRLGYTVAFQSTIGDNPGRMEDTFRHALGRADVIISSGGLGATEGDITRAALARAAGVDMVTNEEAKEMIDVFYEKRNQVKPYKSNRDVLWPAGAKALYNPVGVAPGVVLEVNGKVVILLPGPPAELTATVDASVVPYLKEKFGSQGAIESIRLAVYNKREMELEGILRDLIDHQGNPTIALLIKPGYIEVRLTAKGQSSEEALSLVKDWEQIVYDRLPGDVRPLSESLESLLHPMLIDEKATVATAESCTGGLVGKRLTNLSGSSTYYQGGIISYSNEVKHHLLGVSEEILNTVGAVSEACAKAMAEGTRAKLGTTYGISTTGIAGPTGGTPTKPVGLVYIGIAGPQGTVVHKQLFIGNRDSIRESTAEMALFHLYSYMKKGK